MARRDWRGPRPPRPSPGPATGAAITAAETVPSLASVTSLRRWRGRAPKVGPPSKIHFQKF